MVVPLQFTCTGVEVADPSMLSLRWPGLGGSQLTLMVVREVFVLLLYLVRKVNSDARAMTF